GGEPDHCHMAAIPTLAEEDGKRPNREREGIVRERTRIVNRMKSCLARFGVRNFKPTLRKAPERCADETPCQKTPHTRAAQLHSRYGPPDSSAAQGDLRQEAP